MIIPILFTITNTISLANGLLFPVEDNLTLDKFNIEFITSSAWENLDFDEGRIDTFMDDTKCFIPKYNHHSLWQDLRQNQTAWSIQLNETLDAGVKILNKALNEKCSTFSAGFWKYEFCYHKGLNQFHVSNDPSNSMFYQIGEKSSIPSDDIHLLYDNDVGFYISEFLQQGDECDLTGLRRSVEMHYICGLTNDAPLLQWVKEIKTCQYEAVVSVPELCQLDLFARNEDKLSATKISCLIDDHDEYYNHSSNVINLINDFEPTFLGYGVYFLKPNQPNKRTMFAYSGELSNIEKNPQLVYDSFSQAFSRLKTKKLFKSPHNKVVKENDRFTWVSPVVDLDGKFLFVIQFDVSEIGKAQVAILPEDTRLGKPHNFKAFFKGNRLPKKREETNSFTSNDKAAILKLPYTDESGEAFEIHVQGAPFDRSILEVGLFDKNGEKIPLDPIKSKPIMEWLSKNVKFQEYMTSLYGPSSIFANDEMNLLEDKPQLDGEDDPVINDGQYVARPQENIEEHIAQLRKTTSNQEVDESNDRNAAINEDHHLRTDEQIYYETVDKDENYEAENGDSQKRQNSEFNEQNDQELTNDGHEILEKDMPIKDNDGSIDQKRLEDLFDGIEEKIREQLEHAAQERADGEDIESQDENSQNGNSDYDSSEHDNLEQHDKVASQEFEKFDQEQGNPAEQITDYIAEQAADYSDKHPNDSNNEEPAASINEHIDNSITEQTTNQNDVMESLVQINENDPVSIDENTLIHQESVKEQFENREFEQIENVSTENEQQPQSHGQFSQNIEVHVEEQVEKIDHNQIESIAAENNQQQQNPEQVPKHIEVHAAENSVVSEEKEYAKPHDYESEVLPPIVNSEPEKDITDHIADAQSLELNRETEIKSRAVLGHSTQTESSALPVTEIAKAVESDQSTKQVQHENEVSSHSQDGGSEKTEQSDLLDQQKEENSEQPQDSLSVEESVDSSNNNEYDGRSLHHSEPSEELKETQMGNNNNSVRSELSESNKNAENISTLNIEHDEL